MDDLTTEKIERIVMGLNDETHCNPLRHVRELAAEASALISTLAERQGFSLFRPGPQ